MPGRDLFADEPKGRDLFAKPEPEEDAPVEFRVGDMVGNIPASALQYVEDIPIASPIQTVTGLANVAIGGVQKLIPGEQEKEVYADAVADFVKNRYGSTDAFKQTMMDDPVGVLGDFSALIAGGSGAAAKAGGRMASIASKVGKAANAVNPLNIAVKMPAKAVMNLPGARKIPEKLYQSAAKFGTTVTPADRAAMTKTALKNKIMPTVTGVQRARDIIDSYNVKIDQIIDASGGAKIPRKAMYLNLKELRRELGGVNLDAPVALEKINKVVSKFEKYIKNKNKDYLTAREVQEFKKNIYKEVSYSKKKLKGSRATEKAKKAIARSAKEQLEKAYPELKGINKKEGEMIALMEAIEKSANRIDNRDIIGIGIPLKAMAGGTTGGVGGALAGAGLGVIDTPTVKAKLAILLKGIQEADISKRGAVSKSLEISRQAGRIEDEIDQSSQP